MIDPNQYINDPVYGRLMPNDTWKQYEGKPDLSNVPSEILRLVYHILLSFLSLLRCLFCFSFLCYITLGFLCLKLECHWLKLFCFINKRFYIR